MHYQRVREGEQKLMKKGHGRLIHVSDFVEEENGRLFVRNNHGKITKDARRIIYPGANGDPWWNHTQLLTQVDDAIDIFEELHPQCTGLFFFDQSSAHASLGPDSLRAFEMNKSNGGKQRVQKDTIVPSNNPVIEHRGKIQKMTTKNGEAKGLQQTLTERGFDVRTMKAKCSPICPFENDTCCMARLLSKQDDFFFQESLLEQKLKARGHICIFLPKFHCELNPIEMVSFFSLFFYGMLILFSTGAGASIGTVKFTKSNSRMQRKWHSNALPDECPVKVIHRFFN